MELLLHLDLPHWGALISGAAFLGLSLWVFFPLRSLNSHRLWLGVGLLATSLWLGTAAIEGIGSPLAISMENVRNAAWIVFMFMQLKQAGSKNSVRGLLLIYIALATVAVLTAIFDLMTTRLWMQDILLSAESIGVGRLILQMLMAIGALVLAHNLYTVAAPQSRQIIAPYMAALATMWAYDLNLYTITYLAGEPATALIELRPMLTLLLVPVFIIAMMQNKQTRIRLSRTATFQTVSLIAIGGYLIAMVLVAAFLRFVGGDYGAIAQKSFLVIAFAIVIALAPSPRFRSWTRVQVSKHFFQHRYDYRNEWLRFTETIGKPGEDSEPFHVRVIKAIGDITESPGGLLLLPDESGALVLATRWNWKSADVPHPAIDLRTAIYLQETGRIIDFDEIRRLDADDKEKALVPGWLIEDTRAWVGVPLIHFGRLAGLALLERPAVNRTLDWEDFDMLRIVGRQVASYLSEAQGQEALSEAKRFEEFNRRFAFIIHDVKNIVSQLSLVARNAERHADNPEFRADMIQTLQFSVGRMNDLLARLSQHNKGKSEEPQAVDVAMIVNRVYDSKKLLHNIIVGAEPDVLAYADPARVEQIMHHLVQNAIEASDPSEPLQIRSFIKNGEVVIEVMDKGVGMTPDFIRAQLFKPFSSTKQAGFGIGAYEARSLALAMNGRLEVESREGEGSIFTLILPLFDRNAAGQTYDIKQDFAA